jgi:hypothetical protein
LGGRVQADRGAPASTHLDFLESLTDSTDAGVKYFSGTATYTTTLTAPDDWTKLGGRIVLDLGEVHDIAEVSVNGAVAGIVWRDPYQVDVTDALWAGPNSLQVKVTNSWYNRLVGDAQPGATKIAYVQPPLRGFTATTELLPSGLVGPVRILNRG